MSEWLLLYAATIKFRSVVSHFGAIMDVVKNKIALKRQFEALPESTRSYLVGIEGLLDDPKNFGVALAFLFMKVEEGQHRALKCGLIRKLYCNSAKVDDALGKQHFTRQYFRDVFKNVFGKEIPKDTVELILKAEKVRDKLIHGKGASRAELRDAISSAFDYVSALGKQVEEETKKNPFGDLRGLAGKAELHDPIATFWMLKGLGFYNGKAV